MKRTYRGHELHVWRDRALGGWSQIYYSIYDSAGHECAAGFHSGDDTVPSFMRELKRGVDAELQREDPWDKAAEAGE